MIASVKSGRHTSLAKTYLLYSLGIGLCLIIVIVNGLYLDNNKSPFVYDAAWSPDGMQVVSTCHYPTFVERLAVSAGWNDFYVDVPYHPTTTEICITDAKSGDEQRLTRNDWRDYGPLWSPDGTLIAYISDRGTDPQIYLMELDGLKEHVLTQTRGVDGTCWSPDGKHLAFSRNWSDSNGKWSGGIYTVEIETGEIQKVAEGKKIFRYPTWSPDGGKIAFAVEGQGRTIEVIDLNTQAQMVSPIEIPPLIKPTWSADATRLAFWEKSSPDTDVDVTLAVFDLATQTTQTVGEQVVGWGSPSWSPKGEYVYSIVEGQVMRIAVDGNTWTPVVNYQQCTVQDLALSPNGTQIALSCWSLNNKRAEIRIVSAEVTLSNQ